MKFRSSILISTIMILFVSQVVSSEKKAAKAHLKHKSHKHKQVNIVQETGNMGSDLGVVIRKSPTVWAESNLGLPLLERPQQFNTFSNSNTSNLPNVGGFGRTAEIVNPTILFHSKSPVTVVKSIPAHLGYRNEKSVYSTFNKNTGRVETHDIVNKVPVYGDIESIRTLNAHSIRPLDLQYRRFRKQRNIVQENPELSFNRDERFVSE